MTAYNPAAFFESNNNDALIILNQPIGNTRLFEKAWENCTLRVCADGGANQLYDYCTPESRPKYLPDIVTGDFDSLRNDVREYYESQNVNVFKQPDQYSTDFMKSIRAISEHGHTQGIIALGAMGGRVDQSFSSIHQLFLCHEKKQQCFLLSDQSVTFLLPIGESTILTPRKYLGTTCGIIPLQGKTMITTSGLKWDVTDWETDFGLQISTSNGLVEETVNIKCDKPVLFTAELKPLDPEN